MKLSAVVPTKRNSQEPFTVNGAMAGFTVGDFWSSAFSDLLTSMNRGVLAEFLVLQAIGATNRVMNDVDEVDATLPSGLKIEVKSSAYLQRWKQNRMSAIRFGIERKRRFDYELNDFVPEPPMRHSDLYVFALYAATDKLAANPTNLDDWNFYCIPTRDIDRKKPVGKTIALGELLRVFQPRECSYSVLASEIAVHERALVTSRIKAASQGR